MIYYMSIYFNFVGATIENSNNEDPFLRVNALNASSALEENINDPNQTSVLEEENQLNENKLEKKNELILDNDTDFIFKLLRKTITVGPINSGRFFSSIDNSLNLSDLSSNAHLFSFESNIRNTQNQFYRPGLPVSMTSGKFIRDIEFNVFGTYSNKNALLSNATSIFSEGTVIIGSSGDDTITGDAFRNLVYGRAGNDIINGNGGADKLYGEAGDDIFLYSNSETLYSGNNGYDSIEIDSSINLNTLNARGIEEININQNIDVAQNITINDILDFNTNDSVFIQRDVIDVININSTSDISYNLKAINDILYNEITISDGVTDTILNIQNYEDDTNVRNVNVSEVINHTSSIDFDVWISNNGQTVYHSFDPSLGKTTPITTYFVNGTVGSNTINDGSFDQPFKTISKAISKLNVDGVAGEIIIQDIATQTWGNLSAQNDLNVIALENVKVEAPVGEPAARASHDINLYLENLIFTGGNINGSFQVNSPSSNFRLVANKIQFNDSEGNGLDVNGAGEIYLFESFAEDNRLDGFNYQNNALGSDAFAVELNVQSLNNGKNGDTGNNASSALDNYEVIRVGGIYEGSPQNIVDVQTVNSLNIAVSSINPQNINGENNTANFNSSGNQVVLGGQFTGGNFVIGTGDEVKVGLNANISSVAGVGTLGVTSEGTHYSVGGPISGVVSGNLYKNNLLDVQDLVNAHQVDISQAISHTASLNYEVWVSQDGQTTYHDFNPEVGKISPVTTYFVNGTTGDNTVNDGSIDQPFETIAKAVSQLNVDGVAGEIIIQDDATQTWGNLSAQNDLNVIALDGVTVEAPIGEPGGRATHDIHLYLENLIFTGGNNNGSFQVNSSSANFRLVTNNVEFNDSDANGLDINGPGEFYLFNSAARDNTLDGFNYHNDGLGLGAFVVEFDVHAQNNGKNGMANNNGSTGHDNYEIVRVGGLYEGSPQNIVDIQDVNSLNIGLTSTNAVNISGTKNAANFTSSGNQVIIGGTYTNGNFTIGAGDEVFIGLNANIDNIAGTGINSLADEGVYYATIQKFDTSIDENVYENSLINNGNFISVDIIGDDLLFSNNNDLTALL